MTKTRHLITSAPLAIAAMAALHTVPVAAQEQPTVVLDIPAPAPTAAPSPVVVQPAPQPTAAAPVVQQAQPVTTTRATAVAPSQPVAAQTVEEAAPAPARAAVRPAANERTASRQTPVVTAAAAETAAAPVAPIEGPSEADAAFAGDEPFAAAPLPSEAEIAPVAAEPAAPIEDGSSAALLLALLGVGGIGLAAFFLMRRRRRHHAEVPVIERPIVERAYEPAPAAATAAPLILDREPVVTNYDQAPVTITPVEPARPAARSNGAAVELPRELPENFEDRDRLMRQMVDAEPDRANPFRSGKARAKRARLIMQSIGQSFHERKPRIDLSQYTNIWPELRGWSPRTPAMA